MKTEKIMGELPCTNTLCSGYIIIADVVACL